MSRHGEVCTASAVTAHHTQASSDIIGGPGSLPIATNASPTYLNAANSMDGTSQTCASDLFRAYSGELPVGAVLVGVLLLVASLPLLFLFWKRRQTYQRLVRCGLPTVYWHPKFSQYQPDHPKHLSSSSITNILPRMERLKGPYGAMYGTVYGISTAVIHVAHPVPAMILLGATTSSAAAAVTMELGTGKRPAYNHFLNFCGQGVFTADGDDWRTKRAAVLHSLLRSSRTIESGSKSTTGSFHERIEQATQRAASLLSRDLESAMARANDKGLSYSTDIVPHLQRATVGLIFKYITHSDLSSVENRSSTPCDHESEKDLVSMYLRSITRIRMIILAQSRSIWFLLPRWFYTTFASLYQQEEQTMGPIRKVAAAACASALPNSPLRLLLERHPIYACISGEKHSKNLLDEAITLLFAGQDTSAATLSWTLHLLTLYPEIQSKLADEVRRVVETSCERNTIDHAVPFTKKMIAQMPYMDAIIKESMRLYPVAPFVVRNLGSNVTIPAPQTTDNATKYSNAIATDFTLPKNSLACIWIYSLHRNPQFWNQPDEFQPERWLRDESMSDLGTRTPGAYIPFAAGPRNCIGQPLANVMLRCFLAHLIHQYEFSDERVQCLPCDRNGLEERRAKLRKEMQAGFTVLPRGGLFLTLRHRRRVE